jgi:hypothetical protein
MGVPVRLAALPWHDAEAKTPPPVAFSSTERLPERPRG